MKLELESNLTFLPEKHLSAEGEHEIVCNICQERFLSVVDLKKHNKNHLFSCSDCNQAFNDQITLTKHSEEAHCQDKNFHCTQCDKSFKELRTLRLHLKIHNADYPEHCEVCKKGFRTKWQLKQHLMDHGGKRPYPCPECSFTCKTKQQLNEHRRKHSGEKAYSCPLCGTRFTYRNGLIKHTKLNRCPKKIFTSEGEKLIKKKTKSIDHLNKNKTNDTNRLPSQIEVKLRSEKCAIDQKILDVIQKRSVVKSVGLSSPDMSTTLPPVPSLDDNNNQDILRRAALVQHDLNNSQLSQSHLSTPSSATSVPVPMSLPHSLISSNGTTATFLTNSADISSWAATLPAGTKVTVTHYDASKKSGQGQLVATPTHTETIIVTPPKGEQHVDRGVKLANSSLSLHHHRADKLLQNTDTSLISSVADPLASACQPAFPESFAVDPNEILLKNKPIKQEPDSLPSYQEANFNLSKFKLCNLPPISPIDVQLTAQALLMNVKPDPNFDPNLRIKKECPDYQSSPAGPSSQPSPLAAGQISQPENWLPHSNIHDIKKEVLDELFDNHEIGSHKIAVPTKMEIDQSSPCPAPHPGFLVPQLSIASETEDSLLENDDFYKISLKTEPISPQSSISGSNSDTDHDSFSFHRDLDNIVASFGRASSKQDVSMGGDLSANNIPALPNLINCKSDLNLPDLDIDFSNIFDENLNDINMNEQDFLQMRMDTFDACAAEIMSNV